MCGNKPANLCYTVNDVIKPLLLLVVSDCGIVRHHDSRAAVYITIAINCRNYYKKIIKFLLVHAQCVTDTSYGCSDGG